MKKKRFQTEGSSDGYAELLTNLRPISLSMNPSSPTMANDLTPISVWGTDLHGFCGIDGE